MLQKIKKLTSLYLENQKGKKELNKLQKEDRNTITSIRQKNLTYLPVIKLASIAKTCRTLEKTNTEGLYIEAGCALGGSAILIAKIKNDNRPFNVYDVFDMIPAPSDKDTEDVHERYKIIKEGKSKGIKSDTYYGYQENLYEKVKNNLKSFDINCNKESVHLIKGLVQDTMNIEQPVAFAHIDVDWYDPVMTCLERIFPKLVRGGSIILDDYHDWGGCKKATDEYLSKVTDAYELDDSHLSLKITKL